LLALALSAVGLFGIFAYVVEERRREIGIRMALGAEKRQVLRMLFGTTRRATLAGLGLGLLLSLGIGPVMGSFRYGLGPFDPITFAAVAVILTVTGFLATAIPARRALGVDPAVTLRQDT
jgi:ABC-type antimicrobial peptide transport system permease subunit